MTQEEQLLIKDLCSRLPYGVRINIRSEYTSTMECMELNAYHLASASYYIEYSGLRPYLRPMSSMTEEEKEHIKHNWCYNDWDIDGPSNLWRENILVEDAEGIIDYFNEHHFDYRGLIPMGLALVAPEGMYNTRTDGSSC